jgi:hypothetical protein
LEREAIPASSALGAANRPGMRASVIPAVEMIPQRTGLVVMWGLSSLKTANVPLDSVHH